MDTTFNCDKCGQHISIDEAGVGMSVQCPTCGADLIVPAATNTLSRPPRPSPITSSGTGEPVEFEIKDSATSGKWLNIAALKFHGQCASSPNGRYLLAWHDAWSSGEKGKGVFLLIDKGRIGWLEKDRIICRGELERPDDGKVADNGNFIFNDLMFFRPETPRGTFYAFAPGGEVLISKRFRAPLGRTGLSDDGCFAASQTSFLYLFDLTEKKLLKKFKPVDDAVAGYAARYRFDTTNQILHLFYPLYLYTVELQYRFDGSFVAVSAVESSEMGIKKEGDERYEALTQKRLKKIYLECDKKSRVGVLVPPG